MGFLLSLEVLLSKPLSLIPLTNFLIPSADKTKRKDGISAVVCTRDEPWIEPCLLSIKDIADEIILMDSSKASIKDTIKKLQQKGLNIKYVRVKKNQGQTQLVRAVSLSTRKWILKWDGDFIAYTSGKNNVNKLKKLTQNCNPKKYYGVLFNLANVDIDLFHTAYPPLHREVYLFSYSNILKKPKPFLNRIIIKFLFKIRGREPPRRPFLPLPLWYNKIVLNDVMAMHMQTVKSKERLLERPHMLEWNKASQEFKKKYNCSFDTFFEHTKKSKKGEIFIEQTQKNLRLFDRNKYNYPDILKKWIKDKLHTEIKQTKDFDKKLRNFLDK